MAGANRLQNHEMLRTMQFEHLERQRRWILQQPPEKCPRCNSMETKFCYFNNYSAAQPRYFCKACERHWTKGGLLRDIPVGGSTRPAGASALPGGLSTRPDGHHFLIQPCLVRPATASTLPGAPMTRPGRTIPLAAVNQLHGYYVLNPQGQNPLLHVRSARASTLPPGFITGPGGTSPVVAVNQPFGDYVLNPQGQNPLLHVRSARASTLPPGFITRPGGTSPVVAVNQPFGDYVLNPQGQNPLCHGRLTEPENIFCLGRVYGWVDGFLHGPFYGTSTGPLP